jgi:hypothetical protein
MEFASRRDMAKVAASLVFGDIMIGSLPIYVFLNILLIIYVVRMICYLSMFLECSVKFIYIIRMVNDLDIKYSLNQLSML